MGPVIFNIFLNDIFYFTSKTTLFNYADDNTISYCLSDINEVKEVLERESNILIDWFQNNKMQANPGKFQAITLSRQSLECVNYNIRNVSVSSEKCVKLLGVKIDSSLNFDTHVKDLCQKVSRQINVLSRVAKYLTLEGRKAIYYSFVLSNFNFCPIVWHFCSKTNCKKLEKLNMRALRFVYKDFTSSYEDLLRKHGHSSLGLQRLRFIAIETFKILNDMAPDYLNELVEVKTSQYDTRKQKTVHVPRVKTARYGTNSFRSLAATTWNRLPNHIRATENFNTFKDLISKWSGDPCRCAMCRS
jgi:hypothetical protein